MGIVLSMFTALVVTKSLLKAVYTLGLQDAKYYGKKREAKVRDYVKFSRIAYIISFVVIAAGLIALPIFKGKTENISFLYINQYGKIYALQINIDR